MCVCVWVYVCQATLGAAVFLVSDAVLATNKFHTPLPYAKWIVMVPKAHMVYLT